ncbi:MAG TPA: ribosomal protein S18-alanine N-acetyltransferase [Vicinamibacterales bacterium]|nr:ribosomal protein S18-alanine N-acetyltransferase [Vicinamibacterales bacterium]
MKYAVERLRDAADLDGVIAIEEASFNNPTTREWYENELQRRDVCYVFVIRLPETPVAGFCAFWKVVDQIHINNLAIHPVCRRGGLGRLLLAGVLDEAAALGAPHATLEVRRSNVAARRLYEGAGFCLAGVRTSYYTNPIEDALILSRVGGRVAI